MHEQISHLMDNELSAREREATLTTVAVQTEARATWGRYHLIRAAMRNEHSALGADFAERVAARIGAESATVVSLGARLTNSGNGIMQGLIGLALAASVAAVSIVSLRWFGTASPAQPQTVAGETVSPPAVAVAQNITADNSTSHRYGIHWDTHQPEVENNLNALLVQHTEFTRTSGMGVMSYSRIAGYDTARE